MGLLRIIGDSVKLRRTASARSRPSREYESSGAAAAHSEYQEESLARIDSALDQIRSSHGLPGIAVALDLLAVRSTESAVETFNRAAAQFDASAMTVRRALSEAGRAADHLPKEKRSPYLRPLSEALEGHARLICQFSAAAQNFISELVPSELSSTLAYDQLRLQLMKSVERSRDVHPLIERRLATWRGEIETLGAIQDALRPESGPDLTSSTTVSCSVEMDVVTVSLRRAGPDSSGRVPEVLLTVSGAYGGDALAARCVEDIRAVLGSGVELFGYNGTIKDLSILQELTQLGRVTAMHLVVSKRIAGQVLNSIDFRGCRFVRCNLRAADFSGSTFDASTEFMDCTGLEHARFDPALELDGISTIPAALAKPAPAGIAQRLRNRLRGRSDRKRARGAGAPTADVILAEIRDSEHFQSKFQLTDFSGLPISRDGRRTDSITVHFSGGCVMISKVAGSASQLKAEVFQLVGEQYEAIAAGSGKFEDSPLYLDSAELVAQWAADVCNQYPLPSATLSARAERFRKQNEQLAAAA